MDLHHLSNEDRARLQALFNEAIQVFHDIDALKDGLKETVKSTAEELDVKPAELNRALRIAYKQNLDEEKEKIDTVQILLEAAGRGFTTATMSE